MNDYLEISFEGFGHREISEVRDLINAYYNSKESFDLIKIGFNLNSGYVFIIDQDDNTWMEVNNELKQYFSCPECGNEGFKEDFENNPNECEGCKQIVKGDDE